MYAFFLIVEFLNQYQINRKFGTSPSHTSLSFINKLLLYSSVLRFAVFCPVFSIAVLIFPNHVIILSFFIGPLYRINPYSSLYFSSLNLDGNGTKANRAGYFFTLKDCESFR